MRAFRERYAVPVWRANGIVIADNPGGEVGEGR